MRRTVVIMWNNRPKVVPREKLETAWLVWQDYKEQNPGCDQGSHNGKLDDLGKVRDKLVLEGFDYGESIEFAVAARYWDPED